MYYWWFQYLRRNQRYLDACQKSGKVKDSKLVALFQDFDDIHSVEFVDWWQKDDRGARLFANPQAESIVRLLAAGDQVVESANAITLLLPLSLPKRHLKQRVDWFLKLHHPSKRGHQYAKTSRALYQFEGQPNLQALKTYLAVYDAIVASKAAERKTPYWRIAVNLNITAQQHPTPSDTPATLTSKRSILSATIGRMWKKGSLLVKRVGEGRFP